MDSKVKSLYPNYLTIPAVLVFGVFFVLPTLAAFVLGFTDWNLDRLLNPKFNGIDNFVNIFSDEYFILSIKNTLIFAVLTATLKVAFGLVLALALNRRMYSRDLLRTVFYLPAVLSMVVVGIIFSSIFRMEGMFNHILGFFGLTELQIDWIGGANTALYTTIVAEIWRWSGFNMAVFLAGLQAISSDYYEAARIDGASSFKQFTKVTMPLLMPAFTVNFTFNTIGGLKVFDQVFVITAGGPGYASQVFSTYIYSAFSQGLLGRSTAMGLILFIGVYIISTTLNYLLKKKELDSNV